MSPRVVPPDRTLGEKLRRLAASTCRRYDLIRPHQRILVAVSGGKDSLCLLWTLAELRRRAPFPFEIAALTVDPGFDDFRRDAVEAFARSLGIPYDIHREPCIDIIRRQTPPGGLPCVLCARLRRGILYTYAATHGFDAIALGHHQDDLIETLLMNMVFNGLVASMPPRLVSDDGRNVVIRPLAAVPEAWIIRYAELCNFPVQHPVCPLMEQGRMEDTRRQWARRLLDQIERDTPHVRSNLYAALGRVHPRHLLPGACEEPEPEDSDR